MKKVKVNVEIEIPLHEEFTDCCIDACLFLDAHGEDDYCLLFKKHLDPSAQLECLRCKQCMEETG